MCIGKGWRGVPKSTEEETAEWTSLGNRWQQESVCLRFRARHYYNLGATWDWLEGISELLDIVK